MKKKKTNWSRVPWTPFERCTLDLSGPNTLDPPVAIYRNSRYQVVVYERQLQPFDAVTFGPIVHLSFKVHDKQPHHDWRDMQRIKNEICGPEYEAIELYPAESRLVDCANQYHLFVFRDFKFPFGFQERLVGDGNWENSVQRPFEPGARPADCLNTKEYSAKLEAALAKQRGVTNVTPAVTNITEEM